MLNLQNKGTGMNIKTVTLKFAFLLSMSLAACSGSENEGRAREEKATAPQNKENRVSPSLTTSADITGNLVTVQYGSPKVKGREIWGALVPFGEVWRTGANEATTITFTEDVLIDGQLLKKDTYSFFTIPEASQWTAIFNLEEKQWGAFKYDAGEDALRINVEPYTTDSAYENMYFGIEKSAKGGIILFAWDSLGWRIPFENAPKE
jgi:hypothetical protein